MHLYRMIQDTDLDIFVSYMLYLWGILHLLYIQNGNLEDFRCIQLNMNTMDNHSVLYTENKDHMAMERMGLHRPDRIVVEVEVFDNSE